MTTTSRKPDTTAGRTPYPAWTEIAAQVRRVTGPKGSAEPDRTGRGWHDLLAEEAANPGSGPPSTAGRR